MSSRPRIAFHKFASCDGCQLAFLNLGEDLLLLAERVELVHFAEAGPVAPEVPVDIAFVEGSITTPDDLERIQRVRKHARYLVTIGACATAGGIQHLRNLADVEAMKAQGYPEPAWIETLATSTPIADHVRVDHQIHGCPVSPDQVLRVLARTLLGTTRSSRCSCGRPGGGTTT